MFASASASPQSAYLAVPYAQETRLRALLDLPLPPSAIAVTRAQTQMSLDTDIRRKRRLSSDLL